MDQPAVVPDRAVADDDVADRQLAHFLGHFGRLERLRVIDRAQVVPGRGINTGLAHGRHRLVALEELAREGTAAVVVIPGEAGDVGESLYDIQAHAFHVGEERGRRHEADPGPLQAELVGGFERVDDIIAAACHHDAFRL
jgi:hypothetical protein